MDLDEAKEIYPPIWYIYDHPRDFPALDGMFVKT
jgi:hypothetical protein